MAPERAIARVTKDAVKSILNGFAKKTWVNKKNRLDKQLELKVISGEY